MTTYKSDFLNVLESRGFIAQGSNLEGLDTKLCEGVQSGYLGFDATAKSYHVGNLVQIMMLYWLQQSGHKPITLMGGGTTKVGDPSGKDEMRKMLTDAQIDENIASLKLTFEKFLKYGDGKTDAIMVNNDDWLKDIGYIDFLREYGKHISINRMMAMESVKLRLDREQPLSFLEFNYSILQGYDFVELNRRYGTVLQMGGNDQWGNILSGVELGRKVLREEVFALTTPLITTADGKKMGKTAAGAVWLNADMLSPYDYYQFWRNTHDDDVERFLKLFTLLSLEEIKKLASLQGQDINEAKKILAFEATKIVHGDKAAQEAGETAQKVFEQGGVGDDLPEIIAVIGNEGLDLVTTVAEGFDVSKREARQRIDQGGVYINGEAVSGYWLSTMPSGDETKISFGKKKHAVLKFD